LIIELINSLNIIINVLRELGLKVFIIGARALIIRGVDLGRETRGWDLTIDKHPDLYLRDKITERLREKGFIVQWRKWGFYVNDDVHVDINYAPLILDDLFISRSLEIRPGLLIPSLEDLIILKLMSGERKDLMDLKKIFSQKREEIDISYLQIRARQAGLEKDLEKILRRLKFI